MVDGNAIGPRHGKLEVDRDALENQADAARSEKFFPLPPVQRVDVFAVVADPVAAPALGEADIHDVVDVAHRVLLAPDDVLSHQPCSFLRSQVALAPRDQVPPVSTQDSQDSASFVDELGREAEGDASSDSGLGV